MNSSNSNNIGANINLLTCSFCGKNQKQVRQLIAGPGVYVCDECIVLCNDIIEEKGGRNGKAPGRSESVFFTAKPALIFDFLQEYVVGQESAKRILSVAVYNHYKRITYTENAQEVKQNTDGLPVNARHSQQISGPSADSTTQDYIEIAKSNVLLIGPTGTGKTHLVHSLARFLDVPFTSCDATSFTEAGYVGEDVENILQRLLQSADGDPYAAERGIVYIDEIDKIARKADSTHAFRDIAGEGVQQSLLRMIEGSVVQVSQTPARSKYSTDTVEIDTSNILFVCAGSFEGLADIIAKRKAKGGAGFGSLLPAKAETGQLLEHVESQDLTAFGIIPELIGRLPIVAHCSALSVDDLTRVLCEPKNSLISQYTKLFELDGIQLHFDPDAVQEIARIAFNKKTGARGLRSILEHVLQPVMFNAPSVDDLESVRITKDSVLGLSKPIFSLRGRNAGSIKPLLISKVRDKGGTPG